jgi:hypothetical protein
LFFMVRIPVLRGMGGALSGHGEFAIGSLSCFGYDAWML